VDALAIAAWIILAAVAAWGLTMVYAATQLSRVRDDMTRVQEQLHREIKHWQDEAARARSHAAQIAQEAATWAAGHKQGRDDVVTTLPLIMAYITAQEGGTCSQHGPHEVVEHV
jgi:hypothetical protein